MTKETTQPTQWDTPSEAFNDWWNGEYDDSTNPFTKDTFGYWAWAGWQSALAQPAQEPVAWLDTEWGDRICPEVGYEATITEDHPRNLGWIPLYATPPQREWVLQREWVDLTDEEIDKWTPEIHGVIREVIAQLKERNA